MFSKTALSLLLIIGGALAEDDEIATGTCKEVWSDDEDDGCAGQQYGCPAVACDDDVKPWCSAVEGGWFYCTPDTDGSSSEVDSTSSDTDDTSAPTRSPTADPDQIETGTCLEEWSDDEDDEGNCDVQQYGCPEVACDGDPKGPWCSTAEGKWFYCTPDSDGSSSEVDSTSSDTDGSADTDGSSSELDSTSSDTDSNAAAAATDDDEIETGTCLEEWSDDEDDGCTDQQYGCPAVACDGDPKGPWCSAVGGGWFYCNQGTGGSSSDNDKTIMIVAIVVPVGFVVILLGAAALYVMNRKQNLKKKEFEGHELIGSGRPKERV